MKQARIIFFLFLAALLIATVITVLWLRGDATESAQQEDTPITTTIRVADARQAAFTLVYVAEAEGYFADEGIEVEYVPFTSGRDALQAVQSGDADMGTVFSTPVVLQSNNPDFVIHSQLHQANENIAVVARTASDIEAPEDLSGKTIGVTKGTGGEIFLQKMLEKNDVDVDSVAMVDTAPSEMATVIKNAEVDAVSTWNPHVFSILRSYSDNEVVTFTNEDFFEVSVLVASNQFADVNPDAMQKMQTALKRAEEFTDGNSANAIEDVVSHLSDQPESTIRSVWSKNVFLSDPSDDLLQAMTDEAEWFQENDVLDGEASIDFSELLYVFKE